MLSHPDTRSTCLAPESAGAASEFLAVSTFLKPSFRISVGPRTGQLSVVVQASVLAPQRAERGAAARH